MIPLASALAGVPLDLIGRSTRFSQSRATPWGGEANGLAASHTSLRDPLRQSVEADRLAGPVRIEEELFELHHELIAASDVTPSLGHLQMPSLSRFIGFLPRESFGLSRHRDS
jgi:hypothetical protein